MTTMDLQMERELLSRLDRMELGAPHRKLMFQGGFGYAVDSFDGALMGLAVAALIVLWDVSDAVGGFMLASVFLGYFIGALGAGILADRYGRRRLLIIALLTFSVFSAMTGFSSEPWHVCAWRALAGLGLGAESVLVAPYVAEFVPSRYRGKFVSRTVSFFAFGYIAAAVVGNLVIAPLPEVGWRYAAVIACLPVLVLLVWRRNLPESPRFLISKGRLDEAEAVVTAFENESGQPFDRTTSTLAAPLDTLPMQDAAVQPAVKMRLRSLLGADLRRRTLMLWTVWFCLTGVNYGFTSWMPSLLVTERGLDISESFLFALAVAVAQVPGYYLVSVLLARYERKSVLVGYAAGGAVGAAIVAASATEWQLLLGACLLAAFLNGAAAAYYLYTTELYPTEIRATGMGAASAVARIGAIASPICIGLAMPIIGFAGTFACLVVVLLIACVVVLTFGPPTARVSLEQAALTTR